jgi:hypothetical protein
VIDPMQKDTPSDVEIDLSRFEFATLVGREVTVYSEQFQGRPLMTRVTSTSNGALTIDKSGCNGAIDSLVHNQPIVLQIDYKGQKIAVHAQLKRGSGGKCTVVLGEKVSPISRRRFFRAPVEVPVRLAILPASAFDAQKLAKLRWIETNSINFSAGGVMLKLHSGLDSRSCLILNAVPPGIAFPSLVLARVRHCFPVEGNLFHVGIEFLTKEAMVNTVPSSTLRYLPPPIQDFNTSARVRLDRVIEELIRTKQSL